MKHRRGGRVLRRRYNWSKIGILFGPQKGGDPVARVTTEMDLPKKKTVRLTDRVKTGSPELS